MSLLTDRVECPHCGLTHTAATVARCAKGVASLRARLHEPMTNEEFAARVAAKLSTMRGFQCDVDFSSLRERYGA